ncbi:hypothetical protein [Elioraea sp.]|jgi:uncharacterized protein HemX|nr:hypothetical protein [Elioraea sp.]GIX08706.1 MAG: hypothetical protein KatS3mg116_0416 [Elioraea sp.]
MKAFIVAVIVAVALAVGGWYVLDNQFQQSAQSAFSTSSVRL